MTVSDLIARLRSEDPDAPVVFVWDEDGREAFANIGHVMARLACRIPPDVGSLGASRNSTPGGIVQLKP